MARVQTRHNIRMPRQASLLVHLDFRAGKCRDLVSDQDVTISGTNAKAALTRHGEAIHLSSSGSDYIATGVDVPASGAAIVLVRDMAGAGAVSPVWSDGFGATDESASLYHTTGNYAEAFFVRSGGTISISVHAGRARSMELVGLSWGEPGSQIVGIKQLSILTPHDWDFVLDTAVGGDVRLNVRSVAAASEFGDNEIGFFAMWSRRLHTAEMLQVARQLIAECEL